MRQPLFTGSMPTDCPLPPEPPQNSGTDPLLQHSERSHEQGSCTPKRGGIDGIISVRADEGINPTKSSVAVTNQEEHKVNQRL